MGKVTVDIKKVFASYLGTNANFCVEIVGEKKSETGIESHTLLHKLLDDFMKSGWTKKMEDGRTAKVTLVDYDVDPEISTYLDYYEGDEEEETA
jgi:hypothetical protein